VTSDERSKFYGHCPLLTDGKAELVGGPRSQKTCSIRAHRVRLCPDHCRAKDRMGTVAVRRLNQDARLASRFPSICG